MKQNQLIIFVVAVLIYVLVNLGNLARQERILNTYNQQLEQEYAQVVLENTNLNQSIRHYKTNQGIEELARKKLGYYKNQEIPLRVISRPSTP